MPISISHLGSSYPVLPHPRKEKFQKEKKQSEEKKGPRSPKKRRKQSPKYLALGHFYYNPFPGPMRNCSWNTNCAFGILFVLGVEVEKSLERLDWSLSVEPTPSITVQHRTEVHSQSLPCSCSLCLKCSFFSSSKYKIFFSNYF